LSRMQLPQYIDAAPAERRSKRMGLGDRVQRPHFHADL
jgi:hypothetical protein